MTRRVHPTTLAEELKTFRKKHYTLKDKKKIPMTFEALGALAPVAMMTLYRIETGKATPQPATCIAVRQFMAAHECAVLRQCVSCAAKRARARRAS